MNRECTIKHGVSITDTTWKRDGSGERIETKGYFVTVPNAMGSSERFTTSLKQAFSWIGEYDNEAEAIDRRAQELGEYLSSDKGAWGRQDSFDNNLK